MTISPLTPLGAEVRDIDLREPQDEATAARLRAAWNEHAMLLFRGQTLSKDQLLRAAATFGTISEQGEAPGGVNYVSNINAAGLSGGEYTIANDTGNGELAFHFDHSFREKLLKGIVLYAVEVPPAGAGGDTQFADVRAATRALPQSIRDRVSTLTIRHTGIASPGQADRPLLMKHPGTGEPILFFSHRHVVRILDIEPEENDALVRELPGYIDRPEFVYTHVWEPGDVVIWDNLALQHARTDFDRTYRRHMMRAQIGF